MTFPILICGCFIIIERATKRFLLDNDIRWAFFVLTLKSKMIILVVYVFIIFMVFGAYVIIMAVTMHLMWITIVISTWVHAIFVTHIVPHAIYISFLNSKSAFDWY